MNVPVAIPRPRRHHIRQKRRTKRSWYEKGSQKKRRPFSPLHYAAFEGIKHTSVIFASNFMTHRSTLVSTVVVITTTTATVAVTIEVAIARAALGKDGERYQRGCRNCDGCCLSYFHWLECIPTVSGIKSVDSEDTPADLAASPLISLFSMKLRTELYSFAEELHLKCRLSPKYPFNRFQLNSPPRSQKYPFFLHRCLRLERSVNIFFFTGIKIWSVWRILKLLPARTVRNESLWS